MRDRPNGAELLTLARELLLTELAALLPEDRREQVAAIAQCMTIAERELRFGGAPMAAAHAALAALYGEGDDEVLLRLLAGDIRIGAYDVPSPRREAVRRLLWSITAQKLRESNPDFLAAGGSD